MPRLPIPPCHRLPVPSSWQGQRQPGLLSAPPATLPLLLQSPAASRPVLPAPVPPVQPTGRPVILSSGEQVSITLLLLHTRLRAVHSRGKNAMK